MTRYTPPWLQQGSYAASVDRRVLGALWPGAASTGCAVSVATGMTVNIAAGTVAVPTANNTGTVVCPSDATEQVTLAAAPASGTNRWDLVICQARGNDLDGGANNDFLFTTVTGAAAATPGMPPTPANAVTLAQVYVPGGSASVTSGNITDVRPGRLQPAMGELGYGENTVPAGFSPTTSEVDVTGLAVTVVLPAARKLKLTARYLGQVATAATTVLLHIRYGGTTGATGTQIQQSNWGPFAVGNQVDAICTVRKSLAAGTYAFRVTAHTAIGGSFFPLLSDPTYPAFLLVEDLGAP